MDEEKIKTMVRGLNAKGKGIPTQIAEIKPFPVGTFAALVSGIQAGTFKMQKFSFHYEPSFLEAFGSDADKLQGKIAMLSMFGIPIVACGLAFLVHWSLLVVAPLGLLGSKLLRRAYRSAIFRGALSSEPAFCFLYFSQQVSIVDARSDTHFFERKV